MPEPTHALAVPAQTAIAPMDLLQQALSSGTSPEVIRELVALQQSVERFNWEREERQSKIDFDNALNECQRQIGRIAPNRERENQIIWLDYVGADKVVRPIYLEAGFSIGYSEVESPTEGRRMCATLSRGGVSKEYFSKLIPSGNSKMSTADLDASGSSRAMRYLLFKIFNIAVGIDKDEKLNKGPGMDQAEIDGRCAEIDAATSKAAIAPLYFGAIEAARRARDMAAQDKFVATRDKRLAQLEGRK
jgi:hypothetical protein